MPRPGCFNSCRVDNTAGLALRGRNTSRHVLSALHKPLEHAVKCGAFREDLLLLESAFFPGAAESAATQRDIPMLVA